MTEEKKKAGETAKENLSDEELDEMAGGIVQDWRERERIRKLFGDHMENGGNKEGWAKMWAQIRTKNT